MTRLIEEPIIRDIIWILYALSLGTFGNILYRINNNLKIKPFLYRVLYGLMGVALYTGGVLHFTKDKPKLNIIKQCNTCSTNKHSSDFYLDKRHSDGLRSECKKCSIIKRDEGNYKSKYNLSIEEYEFILTAQNNCCKICSSTVPGVRINRFHVDHCHKTNVVRGLLCEKCNMALGHLRDDPALLRKAADYLENNLNKKIGN